MIGEMRKRGHDVAAEIKLDTEMFEWLEVSTVEEVDKWLEKEKRRGTIVVWRRREGGEGHWVYEFVLPEALNR